MRARASKMIPGTHPILSCAAAAGWEKTLLRGDDVLNWAAMNRAGRAIAAAVLEDAREIGGLPDDARLLVLCGKGNNGGDTLIALRGLLDALPKACAFVVVVPGFASMRPLVRRAFEQLYAAHRSRVEGECIAGPVDGRDALRVGTRLVGSDYDLCLDGLFGLQFRPPLRAPADWLIELVNAHPSIRLRAAVDVPSGVGDASAVPAFRADFTYATGIAKLPLFAGQNRDAVGRVRYLDIGFFEQPDRPASDSFVLTKQTLDAMRGLRPVHSDKRTFGHLFVVSGSRAMPGAVLMAVESAIRSGVGLVTAFVPESIATAFAARVPEAMWEPMPETPAGGLALEGRGAVVARAARCTGLLIGPGLGRESETLTLVAELLRAIDVPTILDADALQPDVLAARPSSSTAPLVLTPHAGEFERIGGKADFRDVARRLRAAIVLKGAPTRISDGGPVYYSPFGGPVLARGGSGDVLAGLVGGQLAQGMPAVDAAARAVVWHGCAADRLARAGGQNSARVTGLLDQLSGVLNRVAGGGDPGPASSRPAPRGDAHG